MNIIVKSTEKNVKLNNIKNYSINHSSDSEVLIAHQRIGAKKMRKAYFFMGKILSIELLSIMLLLAFPSCSSQESEYRDIYYFDVDCVEDIISYEANPYEYHYIIQYYDPDGLYCTDEDEELMESIELYIEETDVFIEFLNDYNNHWDTIDADGNVHRSSLEIGKRWYITTGEEGKYILKQYI